MSRWLFALTGVFVGLTCSVALADKVKARQSGTPQRAGKVIAMTASEVTLEVGAEKKKIPVNEIDAISFEGEPNDLVVARNQINKGAYEEALKYLGKIDVGEVKRPEIKQDVEYYKALCAARQALAGSRDKKELKAAGELMVGFLKNTDNYHYFDACEAVGNILAAMGIADKADSYYSKLAAAPWPEYQMRAGLLAGRVYQSQKEYAKAIQKFDDVIAHNGSGKEVERQRLAAVLGRASAMAASGKVQEATQAITEVIEKAEPDNNELYARAYNARGACYLLAARRPPAESGGRSAVENKKRAQSDFLHVDLLYSNISEQHAEALAQLSTLFRELNDGRRAAEAKAELLRSYPNSPWARRSQP